ncbi:hypothetical protein K2173_012258 [Erythroxylum novogranatense]|uniref:Uncharacterized protein n=1 Tax=Erythroxylum novogranatense TaxID=1862640 RepID=A0AAV8SBW2_9ROSI|nr:hypothetical protein K2173_012258 [Erythroxylum novogranatense]
MGVGARDIQILVCRFLHLSFRTCSRFVQKYPIPSAVFILLFLLYLFAPTVFFFLLYSSPFVFCTALFVRFYFLYQHPEVQNPFKDEKKESQIGRTRERDIKDKNDELSVQEAHKKKEFLLVEEKKPKVLTKEKETGESSSNKVVSTDENGAQSGEAINPDVMSLPGGGEAESESSGSEDENDKEAQGVRNTAVEWNEDDQKNVMDLGISELERNRRLESLIARRRARKSMKLTGDKNPLLDQIGHVLVARNNPFLFPDGLDDQLPGSAPSVLLPHPNPFDLPYDSSEEKPNLMADSFHQEFAVGQHKDMFFCKHESFSLRSSFALEGMQDNLDVPGYSRFKRQLGKGTPDGIIDNAFYQDNKPLSRTISITDLVAEEQSSSKPDGDVDGDGEGGNDNFEKASLGEESGIQAVSAENELVLNEISQEEKGTAFKFSPTRNCLPCPLPRARSVSQEYLSDTSPSIFDKTSSEEQLFYGQKGPWHTPSNSIASDMQVEVSEVGSPPFDATASSSDCESLTYDADIEKEVNSGSDDILWGASPHAPRVGYPEVMSRELSGLRKVRMKETTDPDTEIPQDDQCPSLNFDRISLPQASMLSEVSDFLSLCHDTNEQDHNGVVEQQVIGTEIATAREEEEVVGRSEYCQQELSKSIETTGLGSNEDRAGETESSVKSAFESNANQTIVTPIEETQHFNSTEEIEGDVGNVSAPVELGDNLTSIYDSEEQQEVTNANQISRDHTTSEATQVPTKLSPKSVLIDERSSDLLSEQMQADTSVCEMEENTGRSLDGQSPQANIVLAAPQDAHLTM